MDLFVLPASVIPNGPSFIINLLSDSVDRLYGILDFLGIWNANQREDDHA